jgi:hypothetical protein
MVADRAILFAIFVGSFVVIRVLVFLLTLSVVYEGLEREYRSAEMRIALANNPHVAIDYRSTHQAEYEEALRLVKRTRLGIALERVWAETFVCGRTSCYDYFVGGTNLSGLLLWAIGSVVVVSLSLHALKLLASPFVSLWYWVPGVDVSGRATSLDDYEDDNEQEEADVSARKQKRLNRIKRRALPLPSD